MSLPAGVVPCAKSSRPWVLAATILGSSLAFIDGTVVNIALPALQKNLNATVLDVQWVVEAYALLLAALLLVGGSLGDRFGRRKIYALGITIFAVSSAWCGFAPNIGQLIAARAVQGVGAALLVPGSLAIISSAFPENERGRAIGTWSAFSAITAALGPVLGGWLVQTISWRAVFFINLPIAIVVIAIAFRHVPESSSGQREPLDYLGAILATIGLGALVYSLIESSRLGFKSSIIMICALIGVVFLAAFFIIESRLRNPMLPPALFRSRDFSGANILTLLLYAPLSATMFFLPLNLIQVQHYTATAAGAALLPLILIIFILSRWSGGLINRYGARIPLIIGPSIAALGLLLFVRPNLGGSYWSEFFPAIVILGLGMAISVSPLTTVVMTSLSGERTGLASGINNAASRVAGLLAIAVFGVVILHSFNAELDRRLPKVSVPRSERVKLGSAQPPPNLDANSRALASDAISRSFVHGFRVVVATCALLAIGAAATSALMISGNRPRSAS